MRASICCNVSFRKHSWAACGALLSVALLLVCGFAQSIPSKELHTNLAQGGEEKPRMHAYVSVLSGEDVDRDALLLVLAQRAQLAALGSTQPFILVAAGWHKTKHAALLAAVQSSNLFDVRVEDHITLSIPRERATSSHHSLYAWRCSEYDKVILLGPHVHVRSNLDDLFAQPSVAGAYDYPPLEMNAAVLVLTPSQQTFASLCAFVSKPHSNTGDGGFQGLVNAYFRTHHYLPPFTVGDMRYSLLGNSWGDSQVSTGMDARFKPHLTRTFSFVDSHGQPHPAPWAADPFGAFDNHVLTMYKHELASAIMHALAQQPTIEHILNILSPDAIRNAVGAARPFVPIDHRSGASAGCVPTRPSPRHPAFHPDELSLENRKPMPRGAVKQRKIAYASLLVGPRDVNALLMQHQLLLWTNTTIPHIVVVLGVPRHEIQRLTKAGMHAIVFTDSPFAGRHAGFNKLFLFNLTDYDKLVFLDADAWPLKNVDALFSYPGIAGVPDNFIVTEFNTGVMVIEPDEGMFSEFKRLYQEYAYGNIGSGTDGTDQGFINTVCSDWVPLPFNFNYRFFRNFTDPDFHAPRELFYLTHHLDEISIVHTYTFTKPYLLESWQVGPDSSEHEPPNMAHEYPDVLLPLVKPLWRAWVVSERRWGHRALDKERG
jgi:hypothetical protein